METRVARLSQGDFVMNTRWVQRLVQAYAVDFWGGTWKELLAVRDQDGNVVKQFGTYNVQGTIFPETKELLDRYDISSSDPQWPNRLWKMANRGQLCVPEGGVIRPFWTLDAARKELLAFVSPVETGGYGGEILILFQPGVIVGFTAFTSLSWDVGPMVARRRFPTTRFHVPVGISWCVNSTVQELLVSRYPGKHQFGIFLDHAIVESFRGQGFGSQLFDARIDRLLELGTDVFFGRTMLTATSQYVGNYLARGLKPFAADATDAFSSGKHYFAATRSQLKSRRSD